MVIKMKKSGYHTVFHIYLIFSLVLLGTLITICCLSMQFINVKKQDGTNVRSDWAKIFTENFEKQIIFINEVPQIKQAGIELLQDNHIGLQILDAAGNEVYEYQKPKNTQSYFSNTDLLRLYQTSSYPVKNMTVFIGEVTDNGNDYAYILYFPMKIQKITMYLNGNKFTDGKSAAFLVISILLIIVIFSGIIYGFAMTKAISHLMISIKNISYRCYLPANTSGAFGDLYDSLNKLDEQIKASDKLRKETDTMRREWIANITHDLKTPLSPIKGYAEIIQNDTAKNEDQYKRYAGIMLKNATYMENLIDDLKLTWQLESGMLPLNLQEQNLVRFLRELVIDILNCPEYEDRIIQFNHTDDTILYNFDPKLFKRAFQNLIINAFVHGSQDTEVTLQIASSEDEVNIFVSDNGKGMSPEETDRLFDRYYRKTNTESKTEGTGLGLAIVKNIVELHSGTISVSSMPDIGTSFHISFPCN